jgi:hypothetical protein
MRRWSRVQAVSTSMIALTMIAGMAGAADEEKKPEGVRISTFAPVVVAPGTTVTLRIRGTKLDQAKELQFNGGAAAITAELKEKKKADAITGADAKAVGDTQAEFSVTFPANLPLGNVPFSVAASDGASDVRELRVAATNLLIDEKEPNGGFREFQPAELGKLIRGLIKEDKDVDVFRFRGAAGQQVVAEIFARRAGSLLDAVLTLYDSRGALLVTNDDANKNADSRLTATLPADGDYLLSVQDAHDRGSAWHAYELSLKLAP